MKKACFLFAVACLYAAAGSDTRSFDVGADPKLDISNVTGDIHISQGNNGRVEVKWTVKDERLKVEVEQKGDRIDVKVIYPRGNHNFSKGVDFEVAFPAEGRIDASSVSGSVTVEDISGNLDVNSVSGSVTLSNVSGELSVNTVSGVQKLTGVGTSELKAETVSGKIIYEGNLQGGDYSFTSVSGSMELTVTGGGGFEVSGSAMSGSVYAEFSDIQVSKEKYTGFKKLSGTVNGGGAQVELSTISGRITLK